jgi:hypothetical protein
VRVHEEPMNILGIFVLKISTRYSRADTYIILSFSDDYEDKGKVKLSLCFN